MAWQIMHHASCIQLVSLNQWLDVTVTAPDRIEIKGVFCTARAHVLAVLVVDDRREAIGSFLSVSSCHVMTSTPTRYCTSLLQSRSDAEEKQKPESPPPPAHRHHLRQYGRTRVTPNALPIPFPVRRSSRSYESDKQYACAKKR
jgi:hypothetical protein